MYQRYVCADILFIQVILLLSSPGETPLTYQAASANLLSLAFIFFASSAEYPQPYRLSH
jgi:L-cystine uptake protein TcyP (sodium:dicarboxylate symporter family)